MAPEIHDEMSGAISAHGTSLIEVSVIIVNWNSKDYLRTCLISLNKFRPLSDLEVIVVDGASFDGCGEMLQAEFPTTIFIQSQENIGFAKANNLGAKVARGKYLFLLNPDTEFIEDALMSMIHQLDVLPNAGAVGCKLLNGNRSIQTSCIMSFPTVLNQMLDSEYLRRIFPHSKLWGNSSLFDGSLNPSVVEVLSGACILISRSLFEMIGGFTERYFMYSEDVDLCFKIRKAGNVIYYVPQTSLVHYGGSSSNQAPSNFSNVMMRHSLWLYLILNRGKSVAWVYRCGMLISALIRITLTVPTIILGNKAAQQGRHSRKKWLSILRWSLGMERWVSRY